MNGIWRVVADLSAALFLFLLIAFVLARTVLLHLHVRVGKSAAAFAKLTRTLEPIERETTELTAQLAKTKAEVDAFGAAAEKVRVARQLAAQDPTMLAKMDAERKELLAQAEELKARLTAYSGKYGSMQTQMDELVAEKNEYLREFSRLRRVVEFVANIDARFGQAR